MSDSRNPPRRRCHPRVMSDAPNRWLGPSLILLGAIIWMVGWYLRFQ
jgi:hypothetical protein